MTVNEQRKISEQLEKCPPVTLETVKATFATLKANRPNMLQDLVSTADACKKGYEVSALLIETAERGDVMAMQGLTSVDNFSDDNETISRMAEWSVKCADALLAALDNKEII